MCSSRLDGSSPGVERKRPWLGLLVGLALTVPGACLAGTYVITVQPDATSTDDSYLREDGVTEKNGTKSELRLKASHGDKNRHVVLRFPMASVAGKSVLQGWLRLTQSAGNSSTPLEGRLYPLLESWVEPEVSWANRQNGLAWTNAGGTRAPTWVSRTLVSDATIGSEVSWQVGPLLQAWQRQTLAPNGLLIETDRDAQLPEREVVFRSSEHGTSSERPKLVIHYTDEPPAIASGWAEIQPRAVRTGATQTPLTLWLDVDAQGATPTGAATGIDQVTLAHDGALVVTAVSSLKVNGVPLTSSWTDNGTSVTFRFPRIRAQARLEIDFSATVLAQAIARGIDLPVTVDDTSTPGAWSQALWPGNADGIAGNGDDWILVVIDEAPTRIHVLPETTMVVERLCTEFGMIGEDALGNQFSMSADSFKVVPSSAGSVTRDGVFCARAAGTARIIGYSGALRDTAIAVVTPALTPAITSITLRERSGATVGAIAPGDTMLLTAMVGDGDGFQDVREIEFDLANQGHETDSNAPAFRARFRWTRGAAPQWSLLDPVLTSWTVLPALCVIDTSTNTTSPRTVTLAFVAGRIARASIAGWKATVRVQSATPPDTTSASREGLDCKARVRLVLVDPSGSFSSGTAGTAHLPLATPTDGRLDLEVESNAAWRLDGRAQDLVGTFAITDTLHVGTPTPRVRWTLDDATQEAYLDTSFLALAVGQPAAVVESPQAHGLRLWIDLPSVIPSQDYLGALRLEASAPAFSSSTSSASGSLRATVVSGGLAAQSALAEITPHSVQAGTTGQGFDLYLLPQFQPTDTGINRILVDLPEGYGSVSVTALEVGGVPAAFSDRSASGAAEVVFNRLLSPSLVRLRIRAAVPSAIDSVGSPFVVLYDDTATTIAAQAAVEGNANGLSDGNSWTVQVAPGPLARLEITPTSVICYVGNVVPFSAARFDAYGHPTSAPVTWSVEGGMGAVDAGTGVFTALAAGSGRLIGTSGVVADTATIQVWPARAIATRSVTGPASVHQGQTGIRLSVRIDNLGGVPALLDTLQLSFGRGTPGDADDDFNVTPVPSNPDTLPVGGGATLAFDVDVSSAALTGPLAVSARASALETGSGLRLSDPAPDSALAMVVTRGGIQWSASGGAGTAHPGQRSGAVMEVLIENHYPDTRHLMHLSLANRTSGPGDVETLDGEAGDVGLYLDDGNGSFEPALDPLLVETSALDGKIRFAPLDLSLEPASTRRLFVASRPPLDSRDGDLLDFALVSDADVTVEPSPFYLNPWPLDPPGGFTIDGLMSAQIRTTAVGAAVLNPGSSNQPVFHVVLPPNGYSPDTLRRIALVNHGSAQATSDLGTVRAWVDDGDEVFDADDRILGSLSFTGAEWQLSGLNEPLGLGGLSVFFTVDVTPTAVEARTVRMALPAAPDAGVVMKSGNSGPLDREVESPQAQTVSNLDRVVLTAMPLPSGTAHANDRDLLLLQIAASNNYSSSRTLTSLVLSNRTAGPGTPAELDRVARRLALRADGDGDGVLDDSSVDPVLATGFFENGAVTFAGLAWALPGFTSRQLFVTCDLSANDAADGDILSCVMAGAWSVAFQEPTAVTAFWPLDSEARWTVDGFVASQIVQNPIHPQTLGPGEGPQLALDLVLPPNGTQADVLNSVSVVNLGTAGASDVEEMRLWKDGGDGSFSAGGGDDIFLGSLLPQGGVWRSSFLSTAVQPPGLRVFVSILASSALAESSTVRLSIPVSGVQYGSANDGPIDARVESSEGLLLSTAPLLATWDVPSRSVLGQTVTVRMAVRNMSAEPMVSVTASNPEVVGTAALDWLDGPTPSTLDLQPGELDTLTWHYRSSAVGEARLSGGAQGLGVPSGLTRRSDVVSTSLHRVYDAADRLLCSVIQTMPATVQPGQEDVVPLSLSLTNPGGPGVSDVRVRGLRIRLETAAGQPIVPSDLLSRVVVNEGTRTYLVRTSIESSGSAVDLSLATPVLVTAIEPTTLNLRLGISSQTTAPSFRIVIPDSAWFTAEDATSLAPVVVSLNVGDFPVRSNVARVTSRATDLRVTGPTVDSLRTERGATTSLLRATFENQGTAGVTNDGRLASLDVVVLDGSGQAIPAFQRLRNVQVIDGPRVVGMLAPRPGDGPVLHLALSPPPNLPAGAPLELRLDGTVADSAAFGPFQVAVLDSAAVDAYDASTRESLAVHLPLSPVLGHRIIVEAAAETLVAGHTPAFPPTVPIGQMGITAFRALLQHPGGSASAAIRCDSLRVSARDEARRLISIGSYLSALHVRWNGVEVGTATFFPVGSSISIPLASPDLKSGDSAHVELMADIHPASPAGSLELTLSGAGVMAVDATSGRPVTVVAAADADLPILSGVTRLLTPARQLVVGMKSRMPAALVGDGRAIAAAELTFANSDPNGSGSIFLGGLRVRASNEGFAATSVGGAAEKLEAYIGGQRWAETASLTADSTTATLVPLQPLEVGEGQTVRVELRFVPRAGHVTGRVRLGCDRDDIGVIQPTSALLAIQVSTEATQSFPLWTDAGGFTAVSLEASYGNYPNPFAAGRGATTFLYFLRSPARVSLKLFTPRGTGVATLLSEASKPSGLQQSDRWDGRNGRGLLVRNGMYVAELVVRYEDGTTVRALRKVAVLR